MYSITFELENNINEDLKTSTNGKEIDLLYDNMTIHTKQLNYIYVVWWLSAMRCPHLKHLPFI